MDSPTSDLSASSDDLSTHLDSNYDVEVEEELEGAVASVTLEDGGDFDWDDGPY